MNTPKPNETSPDNPDGARGLRNQAAACRRLAAQARTSAGTSSMTALADHFDEQARNLDQAESADIVPEAVSTQKVAK